MAEEITQLKLEIIDYTENMLIKKIKLYHEQSIINVNSGIIDIKIKKFPKNVDDYYVELIGLIAEDKKVKAKFNIRINKNKKNHQYILLNKIYGNSFEIMFFNKSKDQLKNTINIKMEDKEYTLEETCKTDLDYIKKFSLINCCSNFTINENTDFFLEKDASGSFEIDIIVKPNKTHSFQTKEINSEIYYNLQIKDYDELKIVRDTIKRKLNEKNISAAEFSLFLTMYLKTTKKINIPNYIHYFSNRIYPIDKTEYNLLLNYIIYLIAQRSNRETDSYIIIKTFFFYLELLEKKLKEKVINFRDILSFSKYYLDNYSSSEQYKQCLDLKLDDYISLYNNYDLNWIDFEILFIKECPKESAYSKAFNLLIEVLDDLKTNSALLEILYLIDSGVGKIRDKGKDETSFNSSFNLAMLSKDQIITHIKALIPNIIIRKQESNSTFHTKDSYAESFLFSGITIFYEKTLFDLEISEAKKILIDEDDKENKYVISIFLTLLHEICSHLKLIMRNLGISSPNIINNPHNNYEELKLEFPESGRTFEFYISNDIEKIKFLKFSLTPKTELLNKSLWTKENFEDLNLIVERLQKTDSGKYLEKEISYFPSKINEDSDDYDDYDDLLTEDKNPEETKDSRKDMFNKNYKKNNEEEFLKFKSKSKICG